MLNILFLLFTCVLYRLHSHHHRKPMRPPLRIAQVFDLGACEMVHEEAQAHEGAVWSVAALPDKSGFVSGGADKAVKFWQVSGSFVAYVAFSVFFLRGRGWPLRTRAGTVCEWRSRQGSEVRLGYRGLCRDVWGTL